MCSVESEMTSAIGPGTTNAAQVLAQQAKSAGITINLKQTTPTDFFGITPHMSIEYAKLWRG